MEKITILPADDLEMLKSIVDTLGPVASKHNIWNPNHPVLDKDSWLISNPAVLSQNRNSIKINQVTDSQIKLVNNELDAEKNEMEKLINSVKNNTVSKLKKGDFINPIIQDLVETLQMPKPLFVSAILKLSTNLIINYNLNKVNPKVKDFSDYMFDKECQVNISTFAMNQGKQKVFTEDQLYSQYKKDHLLVKEEKFFESQKILFQEIKKFDSLSTQQIKEFTKTGDLTNDQVKFYIKHLQSEEKRIVHDAIFADHYETRNREMDIAIAIAQRAKAIDNYLNPKKEVLLNPTNTNSRSKELGL